MKFDRIVSSINRNVRYVPGRQFEGLGWHREVLRASLAKVDAMIAESDLSEEELYEE